MSILQPSTVDFLKSFISKQQLFVMAALARGEEKAFFIQKMNELEAMIKGMPGPYGQAKKGDDAIAYLHYFRGGMDWYIIEKDSSIEQLQCMGVANLGAAGNGPELGYICIAELVGLGVELDLHFTPTALKNIPKAKH